MIKVFKRELKANFKSLIFWSIGLFLMGAVGFFEYSAVASSGEAAVAIFDMMPRVVRVMYGAGTLSLGTPEGYYACMFLWLTLIAFAHAILLGASIISKEEKDKTSEFLFSKPINRKTVITAKILVSIINMVVIALVAWISTVAFFLPQLEGINLFKDVNITMIGMFITQIVFFFIGIFISGILKDNRKGNLYAVAVLLITYFISVFIEMSGKIDFLNFLSPFRYFNAVSIMDKGLSLLYIIISAIIIAVTGYFSYMFWEKRDLNN